RIHVGMRRGLLGAGGVVRRPRCILSRGGGGPNKDGENAGGTKRTECEHERPLSDGSVWNVNLEPPPARDDHDAWNGLRQSLEDRGSRSLTKAWLARDTAA